MTDQAMRVERLITTGPHRSIQLTCKDLAEFVTDLLTARSYPDTAKVRAGFEQVFPALGMLLTLRAVADPAVTFATPGLTVAISVSYDLDGEDNLTPPNLALLEELAATDSVDITIHGTRLLEGHLAKLAEKASTGTIRFWLADAGQGPGEESGQPVKDEPGHPAHPAQPAGPAGPDSGSTEQTGAEDAGAGPAGAAPAGDVPAGAAPAGAGSTGADSVDGAGSATADADATVPAAGQG
jgi:hypothetical protein